MSWDKKLDYRKTEKTFIGDLKNLDKERDYCVIKGKPVPRNVKLHLTYVSILLTQIRNGARISEAVDGIIKFTEDKNRIQKIRARKRKKKVKVLDKDEKWTGEYKIVGRDVDRLIVIPKEVKVRYLDGLQGKIFEQVRNGACLYMFNHYKANTHSLRYSFILEQTRLGKPVQYITKMIRHTNIGQIMSYINEEEADKLLVEFAK